ncbi:glycosyltransferase [Coraliomargarita algicola]|uniref:glycosyltransferase n=1 Tax=Coraliomargarita algicola TaxID=3092156 RepID=UPI003CE545E3
MKVLFDYAAFVLQARGGVSRVLFELFKSLSKQARLQCKLFAGFHCNQYIREAPPELKKRIIGCYLPPNFVHPKLFFPINRVMFQLYAKWFNPDICHYTYFETPKVPNNCKAVITVHDMIHEIFPETFSNDNEHKRKQQAVHKADGIICISDNTKKDLEKFIPLENKAVTVIHHGNNLVPTLWPNST